MNYIGSKLSLLNFLEESINKVVNKNCHTFCDLFSGTGIVGAYFKKKDYRIIANDIQYYSYVLSRHYIGNCTELKFKQLERIFPALKTIKDSERKNWICNYLTNTKGVKGFIYNNYCLGGTKNKKFNRSYFSDENGMQCDAIRLKIEEWRKANLINEHDDEYYFLLASLIESIDSYANTASVYGAYLKNIKKSAQKKFVLKPAELYISKNSHEIYNEDINNLIRRIKGDILYLDPPYNHRQYAANYHILETIAKYDDPVIHGKTGLREYENQKSLYCRKTEVKKAFKDLIDNARMKYIFLSYNNEGLLGVAEIKKIMSAKGRYGCFKKEYNRYKADKNRDYKAKKTVEYLHYVICN